MRRLMVAMPAMLLMRCRRDGLEMLIGVHLEYVRHYAAPSCTEHDTLNRHSAQGYTRPIGTSGCAAFSDIVK